jgi:N-acetylmuramoyl-L-alanine amidase CwlA
MEILYNANTKKFNKIKRKQIEDNILNLKTIKNYHFNNKIVKEIMNKMNLISYNKRNIIYKTWYKSNLKSLDL